MGMETSGFRVSVTLSGGEIARHTFAYRADAEHFAASARTQVGVTDAALDGAGATKLGGPHVERARPPRLTTQSSR